MKIITPFFLFKKNRYKKMFFSNTFYVFTITTIIFEVVCSIFIYYFSYNSYYSRIQSQLTIEATRIELILENIFSETHQVMTYVGKQIALHSEKDPQFIEKILDNSSELVSKMKNIYPWSLFDWVDSNNYRVFNSQIGDMRNTIEKVDDSYTQKCPKHPWTLQVSHPTIGNTSGMWVIPAGLGVINQNKKYLGTLNVGLNIAELNAKVQQALASKETSFIVLDKNLRIILQSADNAIDPKSSYYRDLLSEKNDFEKNSAYLNSSISYKNIKYSYYKKINGFPYIILTGFDKSLVQQEFWALLLPRLLELYGLGLFLLCLLYFLRKKLFSLSQNSDMAKKTFLRHINSGVKESIDSILAYSNILIKHLRKETSVIVTKERKIEFLEKIYQEALNIHTVTGTTLNLSFLTINTLIENAIDILTETALKNGISIKTSLDPTLFPFYGDEYRLKQIIIGLISLSIDYSPKNSTIKVSATNKISTAGNPLLNIKIEDNGFSLNADDIIRISEKFPQDAKDEAAFEGQLDLPNIERLIRLHKGTCYICNKWQKGKIISVTLPYDLEEDSSNSQEILPEGKNVYWLFEKS